MNSTAPKPAFAEWWQQCRVLDRRLTSIGIIYLRHGHQGKAQRIMGFKQELEQTLAQFSKVDAAPLNSMMGTQALVALGTDAAQMHPDELAIFMARQLCAEALRVLPFIADDMMALLQSDWKECTGREALDLFKGPLGTNAEGIGSGWPQDGQWPSVIYALLAREKNGSDRPPRRRQQTQDEQERQRQTAEKLKAYEQTLKPRNFAGPWM